MKEERQCEKCLAHGNWEGEHDCPPFLKVLAEHSHLPKQVKPCKEAVKCPICPKYHCPFGAKHTEPQQEGWAKTFDELVEKAWNPIVIKSFIKTLLSSERASRYEKGYEDGESSMLANFIGSEDLESTEDFNDVIKQIKAKERASLVEKIEGMKVPERKVEAEINTNKWSVQVYDRNMAIATNNTLDQVISLLKEGQDSKLQD